MLPYVIKFVSDLWPVDGFLQVPSFLTNKIDYHDITEILLKMALNTINQPTNQLSNSICINWMPVYSEHKSWSYWGLF